MNERFDDIIRKQLEELESPVPPNMFDKIRNQPEVGDSTFDAGLKNKLQSVESTVAAGLFDKMNTVSDLTNDPFDHIIKQKLTGFQTEVPAHMWQRIMHGRNQRRPAAWWSVAAGLLFLLAGSTWYVVHQLNTQESTYSSGGSTHHTNATSDHPVVPGHAAVAEKTVSPKTTDSIHAATGGTPYALTQQETFSGTLPSRSENVMEPEANRKTEKAALGQQEPASLLLKDARKKRETGDGVNIIYGKAGIDEREAKMLNSRGNENAVQTEEAIATIHTQRLTLNQQLRNAAKLSPGQLLKARNRMPVIPCPVNEDDESNNWYVDFYTSAYLVQKSISDTGGGKNAKSGFDSTLQRQLSYNAGINLVKHISSNILIKTGVQYNRLNESFRLSRINERKIVTTTSIRTVIIAPGDTVYIRDTSVAEHIGTIRRRKQNTYQQWDVPVIIGYAFVGENIRLNANAGLIANIRSAYSGEMLADTGQQIIDATDFNGKPVYKTNVGISLYAGLSIIKPLGERTSLLVEPYARIGLQNTTNRGAWFRQQNSSAGVSVGLRYVLKGNGQRR